MKGYVGTFLFGALVVVTLQAMGLSIESAFLLTLVPCVFVATGELTILRLLPPAPRHTPEQQILHAADHLAQRGITEFSGFQVATEVQSVYGSPYLFSFSMLYNALERLEKSGVLFGRWEDRFADEGPRRKLYRLAHAEVAQEEESND
ncbi:MAG: hypothetical protein F4X54_07360 [Chloroflexi bacterium]|nr:hypothetical protein [Chloroflexota bacterium]MYB84535.1 hypothetical protein [Chloroflexota bacterium]